MGPKRRINGSIRYRIFAGIAYLCVGMVRDPVSLSFRLRSMSDLPPPFVGCPNKMNSLGLVLRYINPIAWISGFRRSLTGASVTLLLIGIVSLNIIWSYPWLGMFSACLSMFLVGWIVNHFGVPKLNAVANAPRSVPAGDEVGIPMRLINAGRWPAMDLVIEKTRTVRTLPQGDGVAFIQNLRFLRRGSRQLPPLLVESFFPFHLFRTRRWVDANTTIMVTPTRLNTEDDAHWRTLEFTLKGIASRAAQGDQIHYIGSREYREGVPVRHWDFSAWARLGKPIIREFSSPASRSVRIVVDNVGSDNIGPSESKLSSPDGNRDHLESIRMKILARFVSWRRSRELPDPSFERILSLAASSIEILVRNGAAVTLQFVHQPPDRVIATVYQCEAGGDPSELLVALGSAEVYPPTPDPQGERVFLNQQQPRDEARIILSCRHRSELSQSDPLSELASESNWVTDRSIESPAQNADSDSSPTKDPVFS